jgi:hypothetical protein
MASNAAEDLAWAPHADSPPARVVHLPRYPGIDDCVEEQPEGPCGHHECRYHLAHRGYWDHAVAPNRDCSLDVANEGPHTQDEVAAALGMSGSDRPKARDSDHAKRGRSAFGAGAGFLAGGAVAA